MKRKKSTAKLKKELWRIFSRYVRERDNWTCFTCDVVAFGSGMHAGHFIPAAVGGLALYFAEDNVHAQCMRCNLWLQGNQYVYGDRLGKRRVNALNKLRAKVTKWDEADYLKKIELYKKKYKKLLDAKNKQ
jgi:hypothetical protein